MRVVILGAGFGGLELSSRLSEEIGSDPAHDIDIVLIDKSEGFVFGFSKLDLMFGRADSRVLTHPYAGVVKPGVEFVQTTVVSIDPESRRVVTEAGTYEADILVVALGADLVPEATPGLVEGGNEFYTVAGAGVCGQALAAFSGGDVVVGVTSTPFKCPPAPSETALLVNDFLLERGLRDSSSVTLVMPLPVPVPPSPDASAAILGAFAERGITWHPGALVREVDGARKVVLLSDGEELAYDLLLAVPMHRAPQVVLDSGMAEDGWIPVDPLSLETRFPGVYAVGDVTSVGTPKAGVFAEGQAAVVADRIIANVRGATTTAAYDGHGICYMEFGHDMIAKVDVTFTRGERPVGSLQGPSVDLMGDKNDFGTSRVQKWFGRTWDRETTLG
ncbi:MAG TPA: FAD/NAD(P)-binding oxidoreductase [Frankiaceae bacterium]|jgi:sulfide:quinone oxidoreductase|nr:FAD/NAD(P)-binding oxidoreductase [Frankiaceae bacterium]